MGSSAIDPWSKPESPESKSIYLHYRHIARLVLIALALAVLIYSAALSLSKWSCEDRCLDEGNECLELIGDNDCMKGLERCLEVCRKGEGE